MKQFLFTLLVVFTFNSTFASDEDYSTEGDSSQFACQEEALHKMYVKSAWAIMVPGKDYIVKRSSVRKALLFNNSDEYIKVVGFYYGIQRSLDFGFLPGTKTTTYKCTFKVYPERDCAIEEMSCDSCGQFNCLY